MSGLTFHGASTRGGRSQMDLRSSFTVAQLSSSSRPIVVHLSVILVRLCVLMYDQNFVTSSNLSVFFFAVFFCSGINRGLHVPTLPPVVPAVTALFICHLVCDGEKSTTNQQKEGIAPPIAAERIHGFPSPSPCLRTVIPSNVLFQINRSFTWLCTYGVKNKPT